MQKTLSRRTWRMIAGILALIAAIFMAESFTTLMSAVLDNGGALWRLVPLLALKLPEIVDFALPLALVLGLYFALTGARDDNELIICAAAGTRWTALPGYALRLGGLSFGVSLLFSALIVPASSYQMRMALYDMEVRGVTEAIAQDAPRAFLRRVGDTTVVATPSPDPGARRGNLYVFQDEGAGRWRFDQAEDWDIARETEAGRDGGLTAELRGFRSYSGGPSSGVAAGPGKGVSAGAAEAPQPGLTLGNTTLRVTNLTLSLREEEILPVRDRSPRISERLGFGLYASGQSFLAALGQPNGALAEALARALLCPFAACMALAGAAWSGTRVGRFPALPLTVIAVLGFDVVAKAVLREAVGAGAWTFWASAAGFALAAVLLPLAYVAARRELILIPARGRA